MLRVARRLTVAAALIGIVSAFALPAAATPSPEPASHTTTAPSTTTPSGASTGGSSSSKPARPPNQSVSLTVTSIDPTYLTPGSDLTISGRLTNSGTTDIDAPQVFVRFDRKLINTRSAMASWLSSDDDERGTVVATADLPPLAAGSAQPFTVTVPAAHLGLSANSRWGARALTVGATTTSPITIEPTRTSIVWYSNAKVSPTNVSVLVPVIGPRADPSTGAIDPSTLAGELDNDGHLAHLTPTADDDHYSWVIDPALISALTDLAGSADGSSTASAFLSSISSMATTGRLGLLPYDDADVVALAHANATSLYSEVFERSTKATSDLGKLPTIAWPAAGHADEQVAKTASSTDALAVVRSDEQDYAVRSSNKTTKEPNYTPTARTTITTDAGPTNTLVADPTLSKLVQNTDHLSDAVLTQQLLGELSIITNESPSQSRSVIAMATRDWQPSAGTVAAINAGLSAPWIDATSLTDLLGSPVDSTVTFSVPTTIDTNTVISPTDIDQLTTIRTDADTFSTIFDPDAAASFAARYDNGSLSLLAVSWRSDPDGRTSALDDLDHSLTKEKSGVQLVHGSQIYLVASDTTIRVSVRNTLSDPVTVSIQLTPRRPGLVIDNQPSPLRVDPGTETSAQVSVSAVGNTTVPVDAELLNPEGTVIATVPDAIDIRVNAGVEDVILWIAAALLGVIIVIGLIRTIRRGIRRDGSRTGPGSA